jgi:prepilin-type N-terminal cleavage/methylation domain-containing protein
MLGQMKRLVPMIKRGGFTLVELMVVVAVVAVVLMMAAPSFRDLIFKQRLMGTADQLMTDIQFARTEAASRQATTRMRFKTVNGGMTCYIVHICSPTAQTVCTCDCTLAAGSRCQDPAHEIRTVQLDRNNGIALFTVKNDGNSPVEADIAFDYATGGVTSYFAPIIFGPGPPPSGELWVKIGRVDASSGPSIRTVVNQAGRPRSCAQGGGQFSGMASC